MSDIHAGPAGGPSHLTDASNVLLEQYADVIDGFADFAHAARRLAQFTGVIETLNSRLDTSTSAFHAEYLRSTIYNSDGDDDQWKPLSRFFIQGPMRPFVGDRIHVTDDGTLLLVDSARRMAVDNFTHLQIRSKADTSVEHFSAEEAVARIQKIGEVTHHDGADGISTISRNKWGQEQTDPSVE